MKFKRILSFLCLPILTMSFASCGKTNNSNKSVTTNGENIVQQVNVNFNTVTPDIKPTTMEEAINLVSNSVVTIEASLNDGTSAGAGVLVGYTDTDSYIMTCHHVIADATSLNVILNDGKEYSASLVGGDYKTDIAVISINEVDLTYATMAEASSTPSLGSSVFAIGNPLGTLGGSVTSGIISSTSREITTQDGTTMNLMQTDAAINSGNSGGGLFNTNGELIGIVNAKYSATGVEGLGFAIPMSTAIPISSELITKGYIEGRYNLGITITNSGFFSYISAVDKNGCAYNKLKVNDVISSIKIIHADGSESEELNISFGTSTSEIYYFINSTKCSLGDTFSFEIQRGRYNSTSTQVINVLLTQYKYTMAD